jgi:5'-deoxynucleotidase YfbR-like HD superfamily hydrolase
MQSDADHTWGVIAIADWLCRDLVDSKFIRFAMYHDCGEIAIGDISSVAKMRRADLSIIVKAEEKRAIKEMGLKLPDLTGEQMSFFKMCDLLEGLYHILRYAPFPNEVPGLEMNIEMISSIIFDLRERGVEMYEKIDFTFNDLIRQRDIRNEHDEKLFITDF